MFESLATANSSLAAEWHPTKNGNLTPDQVSARSHKIVWWLCGNDHAWEKSVDQRALGRNCPYCSGKKILVGFNDLPTTHPVLAAQWHPTKNIIEPTQITAKYAGKAWWLAPCTHEWEASVKNRAQLSTGCPVCTHRVALVGFSDLPTTHPHIAAQWHPTKNTATVEEVVAGSTKKAWWLCENNHSYEASPKSRVRGSNCTVCKNMAVQTSINDLASQKPELLAFWDWEKNTMLPSTVLASSTKSFFWKDELSHSWQSSVKRFAGCPYCQHRKLLLGFNDLPTTHPQIAAQWHPTKNENFTPNMFMANSGKVFIWLDEYGHEWETSIQRRVSGRSCHYCTNNKVLPGFNDAATTHSHLLAEFHPTKNVDFFLSDVTYGSDKKAWWLCSKEHEWEALVHSRTSGSNCPECHFPSYSSNAEQELSNFFTSLGLTVEVTNRKVLGNRQEIDVYLPEQKFGIEFNGLYWHSEEQGKNKQYHLSKYLAAKEAGIQLVQIWEDDWKNRQPVILRALAHKLGVTDKLAELYPGLKAETSRVFARKTRVIELTTKQAKEFLENNHIQGFANGSYYLGLQDEQEQTRAVLVLKKEAGTSGKTLNIVRYATSGTVVGGFTKLLKYAAKTYQPDDFITFADHTISDGGLYENNGFVADKELAPDYMYIVKGERKHKFGYRLKRFRDDPELLWDEKMSERELARLNNIPRIWDAGKTRYRYTV